MGYTPNLQRLLPAALLGAVGVDLVEPDDDLRECRPSHGLRVPALLDQPAETRGRKKGCCSVLCFVSEGQSY